MRTQTVFGEGPLDAAILFVGEQPGDQEDLAGRPFVGPAGQLFDAALEEAGIDRTRDLRHQRGQAFQIQSSAASGGMHSKPDAGEIKACRWWLEQERELIRPPLTVALGATAARSLFGKVVTIGKLRGEPHDAGRRQRMLGDGPPQLPAPHARRRRAPRGAARCSSRDLKQDPKRARRSLAA